MPSTDSAGRATRIPSPASDPGSGTAAGSSHPLRDALTFIRSHAAWTLACALGGLVLFACYGATRVTTYLAEARLVVHQGAAAGLGEFSALAALTGSTPSAAELALLESRSVAERVLSSPEGDRPATPGRPGYSRNMDLRTVTRDAGLTPFQVLRRRYFGPRVFDRPSDHPSGRLFAAAERLDDAAPNEVRVEFLAPDRVRLSKPSRFSRYGLAADKDAVEMDFTAGAPLEYSGLRLWLEPAGQIEGQSYYVRHVAAYKARRDLQNRRRIREDPPKSGLLSVLVEDTDPYRAAETANAIANNFLDLRLERGMERSSATTELLSELLEKHLAAARDMQGRLVELQTANPMLVNPTVATGAAIEQIADLNANRASLALKRSALELIVREVEDGNPFALSQLDAATVATGLNADPITSELLAQIAQMRGQTAEASATRSPLHADVAGLMRAVTELEDQALAQLRGRLAGFEAQIAEVETATEEFRSALSELPSEQREMVEVVGQLEAQAEIAPFLGRALQAAKIQDASATKAVELIDTAAPPDAAHSPSLLTLLFIGALLGGGLGLFVSNLRSVASSAGSARALAELPALSVLPRGRSGGRARGPGGWAPLRDDPFGPVSEGLRQLRSALGPELGGVYGVTSTVRREGRSLVALGLAQALAATDRSVLLIDADRSHAALAELLQAPDAPKPPSALPASGAENSDASPDEPLHTETPGLDFYTAGEDASPDRFASRASVELFERLRRTYDCIVVDLPPVLEGTDACTLGAQADAMLFVHRPRRTNDPDTALARLHQAHVPVVGAVVNAG